MAGKGRSERLKTTNVKPRGKKLFFQKSPSDFHVGCGVGRPEDV